MRGQEAAVQSDLHRVVAEQGRPGGTDDAGDKAEALRDVAVERARLTMRRGIWV